MEFKNPKPVSQARQEREAQEQKEIDVELLKRQLQLSDEANMQFMEFVMSKLPM